MSWVGVGVGLTTPRGLGGEGAPAPEPFTPSDLFAAGEKGAWYDVDPAYCYQDAAGATPASVGDPVGLLLDRSGNGNHASQASAANRPLLQQTAGLYYLQFDGVDDIMVPSFLAEADVPFDASLAFDPQGENFVMFHHSGTIYIGVGEEGSANTTLNGGFNNVEVYWDNVPSGSATRDDNFVTAQTSNLYHVKAITPTERTLRFGILSAGFPGPLRVSQVLVRSGDMTEDQMASWATFAGQKVGVTL